MSIFWIFKQTEKKNFMLKNFKCFKINEKIAIKICVSLLYGPLQRSHLSFLQHKLCETSYCLIASKESQYNGNFFLNNI